MPISSGTEAVPGVLEAVHPIGAQRETLHFYRGRSGLCAVLQALDLKPGDEVVLQAFTCLAVPSPIVGLRLRPVYADIDPRTYGLDPAVLESRITSRTRAIIVQHTFGIPCALGAIVAVARKYGLSVIEDCCHVLGSTYNGRPLGDFGDAAFYSYEWGKPLVIGLGGAVRVCSGALADKLRRVHARYAEPSKVNTLQIHLQYFAHSRLRRPWAYWAVRDVYRLLSKTGWVVGTFERREFEGSFAEGCQGRMARSLRGRLQVKLQHAHSVIGRRRALQARYETELAELGLKGVCPAQGSDPVLLRYPLLARDKPRFLREARLHRIEAGDWFATPVHPLTRDRWRVVGYEPGQCPVAEDICRRVVTLPLHPDAKPADTEKTLRFIRAMHGLSLIE